MLRIVFPYRMSVENNEHQQSMAETVTKPSLLNEKIRKVLHLISLSITCLKKYVSHIYSPYDQIKPL
jgi:hypothetical protein